MVMTYRAASDGERGLRVAPMDTVVPVLSARAWAVQQYGLVELGDRRLNRRVVKMGAKMAAKPDASLPNQMGSRSATVGAYRLLNNERVSLEALVAPHIRQTLAAAGTRPVVLLTEDSTELDYTAHPSTEGLGLIGNGKGRGLLLHSTLAVDPDGREVLGLAHVEVVLRQPTPARRPKWSDSPVGRVWETSARTIGRPPAGVQWVHVSDRESDDFAYLATCIDLGKQVLLRAYHNRVLVWDEADPRAQAPDAHYLLDYARSLPPCPDPQATYPVQVPARKKQPARTAQVVLQWSAVTLPPPTQGPPKLRQHAPIRLGLLRVWEPDPPASVEPIEWVLLSSLPITTVDEARRTVAWYTCRWLCEDYHMALKTGCRIEQTELDHGDDIRRLLGFTTLQAVRLLQLRQAARQTPDLPAQVVVGSLMVAVLVRLLQRSDPNVTAFEFWQAVARLGGHQGRRSDGPPGWRTLWKGWRYLADLTEGARLFIRSGVP